MKDNQYDAGSVKDVRKRKSKAKLSQERNDAELEELINTPGGAYLVWRILNECRMYTPAAELTTEKLAFHEGQRSVGLWLLAELVNVNEKLYQKVRNIGTHRDKGE